MRAWPIALTILFAAPASAEDLRDLCADRPGLGTPPCTVDSGHVMVETGLVDWTRERDAATTTDTVLAGDTLVRLGIADHAEVRIGWTPFGHVREKDRASGAVTSTSRVGDVTLALVRNLANPDGSGVSIAVLPFATLPVGRMPVGAGDWGAGVIVPASFDLGGGVALALSPEVDAAVDGDGEGRHLAYGSVIGLEAELNDRLSAAIELSAFRDRDPEGHATEALGALSIAWQPGENLQFDAGANVGLNHASADVELYVGISRRF